MLVWQKEGLKMETIVDQFGRIVIPKKIQSALNLRAGTPILFEERNVGVLLKPVEEEPILIEKDGVLVFSGKVVGDIESCVDLLRQERTKIIQKEQ